MYTHNIIYYTVLQAGLAQLPEEPPRGGGGLELLPANKYKYTILCYIIVDGIMVCYVILGLELLSGQALRSGD